MMNNILIIAPSWVGDIIMAQVICQQLKNINPHTQITILAPEWSIPISLRMTLVDTIIEVPFTHNKLDLYKRYKIGKALRKLRFNQAIIVPGSWKSALIPFFANIPIRTGYLGEFRFGLLNDIHTFPGKSVRIVDHYLYLSLKNHTAVAKINTLPKLQVISKNIPYLQKKFNLLTNNKKKLALCAGAAFGPSKQWPVEHCATLIDLLQPDWEVWLFGSVNDQTFIDHIINKTATKTKNFAGKLSLLETIDLLSCVNAIVSNDSGLMHMGSSLDIPLIALYGSTPAEKAPPLSNKKIILEAKELSCRPCDKKTCSFKHFQCMHAITPQMVKKALLQLIL